MTTPTNGKATTADPTLERLLDELTDRLAAGEAVDLEDYARLYPQHADVLRRCLPAMEAMAGLGRTGSGSSGAGALPADTPHAAADVLGDFRILREVGRGGMGVVYEAEQLSLRRRVALKVLPLAAVLDERHLKRFRKEAQAAGQLHHTNIVPVYAVGCERGVHYYAMQFIDGRPLTGLLDDIRDLVAPDRIAPTRPAGPGEELAYRLATGGFATTNPMPADPQATATYVPASGPPTLPLAAPAASPAAEPPRPYPSGVGLSEGPSYVRSVARLGIQAAEALEHAHSRGVVHRDIKPANLLLDGLGNLWVTDFGLARLQDDRGLTLTGDVLGTLRYMSPEQAAGSKDLDHRTDVYSLGATLYELLALQPAVAGSGQREILRAISADEPPRLRRVNRAIPRDLETIVAKAMAKEPAKRYATARALAEDLRSFLEHRPISARRPRPIERAAKWVRRHRVVTASAACVAVASMIAMAFALLAHQGQLDKLAAQLAAQRADQGRLEARVDALVEEAQRRSSGFAPDYDRAVALLTEAIAHRPDDADLYLYRGGARHELHQHTEAIADLEQSLSLRPARNPAAHWMIALCALQLGHPEKATRHQEQAEKEAPDSVESLVAQALGLAYDERGIELMDRAIEREPFNPALYAHRGRIAANLVIHRADRRLYDRAVEDLEKALKGRPGDPAVFDPLCYLLLKHAIYLTDLGGWPSALARAKGHLDDWRRRNPRDPLALWLLADYHLLRGEFESAAEAAREGQRLAPDNPEIALRLGQALDGVGRHEEALRAFDRSLELRPTLRAHAARAKCLALHLGQKERALLDLAEADRQVPVSARRTEDWTAYLGAYGELWQNHDVSRVCAAWVAASPRSSYAYYARGEQRLFTLGDSPGAVEDFSRALELGNPGSLIYWERAIAHDVLGHFDEALADIDRHIQSPDFRPTDGVRTQEQEMCLTCSIREKGEILEHAGHAEDAGRAYREAWSSALRVLAKGPPKQGLASFGVIGEFYGSLAALIAGECRPDEASRVLEALGDQTFDHANTWMWNKLDRAYHQLGLVLSRTDQADAAERAWQLAILLWERAIRANPSAHRDRLLARGHKELADLLRRSGRIAEAEEHERRSREAVARWRKAVDRLVQQKPDDAAELNVIAWWLATWPVPAILDAGRAVELARKTVAREPKNAAYWNTLGVALYRSGDWDQAAEALGRSRELLGKDEPRNAFFLAMARWRHGDRDKARALLKRAVAAAGERGLRDDELRRIHAEAAALIDPKPPPTHRPEK
jgi:serine/threonine protein kinase/Flp pilus assembly protein TadD